MDSVIVKDTLYVRSLLNVVPFFILFISSMRLIFPSVYHLACVGFLFLYFHYFFSNRRLANTFCIMAIFTLVDNGGSAYSETPSLLRYICYLAAIAPYLICKFSYRKILIILLICFLFFSITLFNLTLLDTSVLRRDIFILFLVLIGL